MNTPVSGFDDLSLALPINNARHVLSYPDLEPVATISARNGQQTHVRWLGNLSVKVSDRAVTISGALARWYHGNTIRLLSGNEYLDALDQLADRLHVNLRWASVTRVNYAITASMPEVPTLYLRYFFPGKRYRIDRSQEDSVSLHLADGSRTILAYNKSTISNVTGNLLRIEQRYRGKVGQKAGHNKAILLAGSLADPVIEKHLAQQLLSRIEEMLVLPMRDLPLTAVRSTTDLHDHLLAEYLKDQDRRERLLLHVDDLYRQGQIPNGNAQRLRALLKSTAGDDHLPRLRALNDVIASASASMSALIENAKSAIFGKIASSPSGPEAVPTDPHAFAQHFITLMQGSCPLPCFPLVNTDDPHRSLRQWYRIIAQSESVRLGITEAASHGFVARVSLTTLDPRTYAAREKEYQLTITRTDAGLHVTNFSENYSKSKEE